MLSPDTETVWCAALPPSRLNVLQTNAGIRVVNTLRQTDMVTGCSFLLLGIFTVTFTLILNIILTQSRSPHCLLSLRLSVFTDLRDTCFLGCFFLVRIVKL